MLRDDAHVPVPLERPKRPVARGATTEAGLVQHSRFPYTNLTEVEFVCAVARKLREGAIAGGSARAVLREFETHVRRGLYRRVLVGDEHFEKARQEIGGLRLPLKTLDALHLAVCAVGAYEVATADPQMARNARALGLTARLLAPARTGGEAP